MYSSIKLGWRKDLEIEKRGIVDYNYIHARQMLDIGKTYQRGSIACWALTRISYIMKQNRIKLLIVIGSSNWA